VQTFIKYVIHIQDMRSEDIWEAKAVWMYYAEFVTDILVQFSTFCYYALILVGGFLCLPCFAD